MQDSTYDPLDLNKRQMHSGQYDIPPADGGTWDQLHEQAKAKQQKTEKSEKTKGISK